MSYGIDEVDLIFDELNEKIDKTLQNYVTELRAIRAGRANPHILDKIVVDYYGTPTPIHNMANISVPEARLLVISAWDKSQLKTSNALFLPQTSVLRQTTTVRSFVSFSPNSRKNADAQP